jgi:PAS domain S-box-containing protein
MCLTVSTIPIGIISGIQGIRASIGLIILIFSFTFFVSLGISYFITRPIVKLTSNINEISKGKLEVTLSPSEIDEIDNLTDSLNRIMASLKLAIHKVGVKKGEIFEEKVQVKEPAENRLPLVPLAENKRIDEKLPEQEFDSVFVFDENANILDCNENMYKKLGYTKEEMLTLNMADFDALESREEIINKINEIKKTGSLSFKTIHKKKDGSAILVNENLQYLKDKNEFKAVVREDHSPKTPL